MINFGVQQVKVPSESSQQKKAAQATQKSPKMKKYINIKSQKSKEKIGAQTKPIRASPAMKPINSMKIYSKTE